MTSGWQMRALPLIVVAAALLVLAALPSPSVLAEVDRVPPTPTNEGAGDGGAKRGSGDRDRYTTPEPLTATVSGYVYDYSTASRQGSIRVVLDGGSWNLETLTDSNGYYRFGNLGEGTVVVSLALPPEATAITPDWVLNLHNGEAYTVNLGYCWGDKPPLPVTLSGRMDGGTLALQVANHTLETITGGRIDVRMPKDLQPLTRVQASQGAADFRPGNLQLALDDLPADARAALQVSLMRKVSAAGAGSDPYQDFPLLRRIAGQVQVVFTYDQQITPQRLLLDASEVPPAMPAAAPPVAAISTPADALREEGMVSAQEASAGVGAVVAADEATAKPSREQVPILVPESAATGAAGGSALIPVTGGLQGADAIAGIAAPAVLIVGLMVAGWRALRSSRPR